MLKICAIPNYNLPVPIIVDKQKELIKEELSNTMKKREDTNTDCSKDKYFERVVYRSDEDGKRLLRQMLSLWSSIVKCFNCLEIVYL